ncbi:MAG: alpha/beta hydrolase domain-containing protein [Candidatus Nanopelagicales bacterium]
MRNRRTAHPLLATALAAVTALATVSATLAVPSAADAATPRAEGTPMPTVEPITGRTTPFGAALQDLRAAGYVEREYRVTLTDPQVYAYTGTSTEVSASPAPPSPEGAYRSRMLVRLPKDPADFNGRVLVEMLNTTAQLDLDVAWQQAHGYLLRDGWAYVGLTVQQTGLSALNAFKRDPRRYAGLGLNLRTPAAVEAGFTGNRDPSLAWDLVSQVGALVGSGADGDPLRGYDVGRTYLTGQSQMAGYAVTYVNAIHPRAQVYDGFLVVSRSARATNLGWSTDPTSTTDAQLRLAGGGTPVLNLQTETDVSSSPLVRRPDADTTTDRFRLWEVAGSAHNDEWASLQSLDLIARDFPLSISTDCQWRPPTTVTRFPVRYVWHAALDRLDRWASGGAAPPTAPRIALSGDRVLRDRDGNARGGVRIAPMDVPLARYAPTSPGALFCGLTGAQTPFSAKKQATRYGTTARYVTKVRASTAADVRTGYLLREDRAALVAAAKKVVIPRR